MSSIKQIPATVLNGYLGVGRMTVLNYSLENCDSPRIAVIVTVRSEITIDSVLLVNQLDFLEKQ